MFKKTEIRTIKDSKEKVNPSPLQKLIEEALFFENGFFAIGSTSSKNPIKSNSNSEVESPSLTRSP